jgi:single-stranded-DNA-specific exonuclease
MDSPFPLYEWRDLPGPTSGKDSRAESIAREHGLPLPIARLLAARGFADADELNEFLQPDLRHLSDPSTMPGMTAAAERIWAAIRAKEPIVVFGDFDADGISATAVLVQALAQLGAEARPFLPERKTEGYGLTRGAIKRCLAEGPRPALWITVDCGITACAEVDYLRSLGIAVIVTDHHEPEGRLPAAEIIIDPMLDGTPRRLRDLCGAGVAFKLVHALVALGKKNGWHAGPPVVRKILAAAAVATVADIVPLRGENRTLVHAALSQWERFAGVGLTALLGRASQKSMTPDEETFAFLLAPRLNAAGRMASATLAYDLLTTSDPDTARQCAVQLEQLNAQRKTIEQRIFDEALAQCGFKEGSPFTGNAVVVAAESSWQTDKGWHPGVIGIVASRLQEMLGVPAAVIALDGADPATAPGRGSLRAGDNYDAVKALTASSEALDGFGGHAHAAGFNLKAGELERFRHLFSAACAAQCQSNGSSRATLMVDGWLAPKELTLGLYDAQQRLAPFGPGNPKLRWGVKGLEIRKVFPLGTTGAHLTILFAQGNTLLPRAVWFNQGAAIETIRSTGTVDAVFELARNEYGGDVSAELHVIDLRPAERFLPQTK